MDASRIRDQGVPKTKEQRTVGNYLETKRPVSRCAFWVLTPNRKAIEFATNWRKRVESNPPFDPRRTDFTGFEGRETHRTLFASGDSIACIRRQLAWEAR